MKPVLVSNKGKKETFPPSRLVSPATFKVYPECTSPVNNIQVPTLGSAAGSSHYRRSLHILFCSGRKTDSVPSALKTLLTAFSYRYAGKNLTHLCNEDLKLHIISKIEFCTVPLNMLNLSKKFHWAVTDRYEQKSDLQTEITEVHFCQSAVCPFGAPRASKTSWLAHLV